jgi:hypothetical protein
MEARTTAIEDLLPLIPEVLIVLGSLAPGQIIHIGGRL